MADSLPAEVIIEGLSPYLGPHTARTAVRTFSQRALGATPDKMTLTDALLVVEALRPTLGALLGAEKSSELLEQLVLRLRT